MRLRTKAILVAVPIVTTAIASAVIVVRMRRKKKSRQIMSEDLRASVEDIMRLKGEDFVPDGLGTSLYHRKLATLTDKQLVGLYALTKAIEVMRQRGMDFNKLSKDDRRQAMENLLDAMHDEHGRQELLAELGGFGADLVKSIMRDGMALVAA